jgi:hypothetical protein
MAHLKITNNSISYTLRVKQINQRRTKCAITWHKFTEFPQVITYDVVQWFLMQEYK